MRSHAVSDEAKGCDVGRTRPPRPLHRGGLHTGASAAE